jgi:hypothetical protein
MPALRLMLDQTDPGPGTDWQGAGNASDTNGKRSVQVTGSSNSGTWTAQVKLYGANDQRFPQLVGTFDISNLTPSEAEEIYWKWEFFRAELVSTTGSATKASVIMSV